MEILASAKFTLRSRRFWIWQIAGIIIYGLPAAFRFATGSMAIPILNFPGFWIGHYIPGNFLEKLLVNSFFPGGAGAVAGEIFFCSYQEGTTKGRSKYLHRLAGAFAYTSAWSIFQFVGYSFYINGPYGSNIFEYVGVFPINFTLAALSVFTSDVMHFLKSKVLKIKNGSFH